MCKYFLGIDTSNYKTSIAITSLDGDIVFEKSEFLEVGHGDRGLRQQEAFFKQSNALPLFVDEAFSKIDTKDLVAIGVSEKPRRVEGSYMPCFRAGVNCANILSSSLHIPTYYFSHQEGHIEAVLSSSNDFSSSTYEEDAIFFHLSGGTTEILKVKKSSQGYDVSIIGGTKDISIGMLLDRIGVKLGYSFPAGKYLDEIALNNEVLEKLPKIKIDDGYFNLSGLETKLMRSFENYDTKDNEDIDLVKKLIPSLFFSISQLLYEASIYLSKKYNITKIYFCGGVASSASVRNHIKNFENKNKNNIKINFGEPSLSGDNAVGIARLAASSYQEDI